MGDNEGLIPAACVAVVVVMIIVGASYSSHLKYDVCDPQYLKKVFTPERLASEIARDKFNCELPPEILQYMATHNLTTTPPAPDPSKVWVEP